MMGDLMERIDFVIPGTGQPMSGFVVDRYDDADGIAQTLIENDEGRQYQLTDAELAVTL